MKLLQTLLNEVWTYEESSNDEKGDEEFGKRIAFKQWIEHTQYFSKNVYFLKKINLGAWKTQRAGSL